MGALELHEKDMTDRSELMMKHSGHSKIKDECAIVFKVYDNCRSQNCLTPREIGPAMTCVDGVDTVVTVPGGSANVSIDHLRITRIVIQDKQPNPFKSGFWDIDIKYVFEYRLTFREADGTVIEQINAFNIFNMKVCMFGSVGDDLTVGTDLLRSFSDNTTFEAGPFVYVEAKAVSLSASIHREHRHGEHYSVVYVTIGLFSIIKLFRLVNLNIQSKGFCIPNECEEVSNINPCEYFEELDFPMDVFTPPQRPEFMAGVSSNLPNKKKCI